MLLNLDTILWIRPERSEDGSVNLRRLHVSDSWEDDILISEKEYEEIKAALTKNSEQVHGKELCGYLNRLILAIERLSVRIPSSIRIHP